MAPKIPAQNGTCCGDMSRRISGTMRSTFMFNSLIVSIYNSLSNSSISYEYFLINCLKVIYFILFPKSEPPSVALIVVTHFGERSMNSIKEFL